MWVRCQSPGRQYGVEELLVKGLEIMINGIHLFHQSRISETAVYKGQDTNIGTPLEIFDLREILPKQLSDHVLSLTKILDLFINLNACHLHRISLLVSSDSQGYFGNAENNKGLKLFRDSCILF